MAQHNDKGPQQSAEADEAHSGRPDDPAGGDRWHQQGNGSEQDDDPSRNVQGEGDYRAGEVYNRETSQAARDRPAIEEGARAAADALDSTEGQELAAARRQSSQGPAR